MSFFAELEGMSLPDILRIIGLAKLSGVANVHSERATVKVVFKEGRVIYASRGYTRRLGDARPKRPK